MRPDGSLWIMIPSLCSFIYRRINVSKAIKDLVWTPSTRQFKDLIPWEHNPRQINQDQALRLRQSYRKFNQALPFLIGPGNELYDGHQRHKVWGLMDEFNPETEIQVMVASRALSESERKEFTLYLEQAKGSWDYDVLGNVFDTDLLLDLGFTEEELHIEMEPLEPEDEDEEPEIDAVHELLAKWGVETGDTWFLGEHKVVCGDCMDPGVALKLLIVDNDGAGPWAVVTDPPYGIDLDTDYSKMGVTKTRYEKIIGDEHPWDPRAFMELYQGASSYWLWGADYYLADLEQVMTADGSLIVWAKAHQESENEVFGSSFEILWTTPKRKRDIWYILRIRGSGLGLHPTQKPLDCMRKPVQLSEAELIVDPYLGTGTTLIACEREGVICQGAEISPGYVAVILERWSIETGLMPIKVEETDEK